jgi:formimidoylglutamate deiminase
MSAPQVVEADLTWTGARFEPGIQVAITADGRIDAVGQLARTPTRRLAGQALLPGLVNVHSHAFQRGLRGRGERFPAGSGSFWTWREAMYELVESLDAPAFVRLCRRAFGEMLDAGITTVGEFHYLHHTRGTTDWAFDRLVLEAAREAGIRIVLLNAYYRAGGIGRPMQPAQRRFDALSPAAYWEQMERLATELDSPMQHFGTVAHSIRAVSIGEIRALHQEAVRRGLVFHMHVEEQALEIAECLAAHGCRPMELLSRDLQVAGNLTAVHCTHTDSDDMARFLETGGTVCICPLTEANLGDGLPGLAPIHAAGGRLSLGTDSNARICFLEEMRWLEYGQRLKGQSRGVLADGGGHVARALLEIATVGGAQALGVETGRIERGRWADLAAVDLNHPAVTACDEDTLLDALVFGAGHEVVWGTCVGGSWRERVHTVGSSRSLPDARDSTAPRW